MENASLFHGFQTPLDENPFAIGLMDWRIGKNGNILPMPGA